MTAGNIEKTSANLLPLEYAPSTRPQRLSKPALIIGLAANSSFVSAISLYQVLIHGRSPQQLNPLSLLWGLERILAWGSIAMACIGLFVSVIAISRNRGRDEILGILSYVLFGALLLGALYL